MKTILEKVLTNPIKNKRRQPKSTTSSSIKTTIVNEIEPVDSYDDDDDDYYDDYDDFEESSFSSSYYNDNLSFTSHKTEEEEQHDEEDYSISQLSHIVSLSDSINNQPTKTKGKDEQSVKQSDSSFFQKTKQQQKKNAKKRRKLKKKKRPRQKGQQRHSKQQQQRRRQVTIVDTTRNGIHEESRDDDNLLYNNDDDDQELYCDSIISRRSLLDDDDGEESTKDITNDDDDKDEVETNQTTNTMLDGTKVSFNVVTNIIEDEEEHDDDTSYISTETESYHTFTTVEEQEFEQFVQSYNEQQHNMLVLKEDLPSQEQDVIVTNNNNDNNNDNFCFLLLCGCLPDSELCKYDTEIIKDEEEATYVDDDDDHDNNEDCTEYTDGEETLTSQAPTSNVVKQVKQKETEALTNIEKVSVESESGWEDNNGYDDDHDSLEIFEDVSSEEVIPVKEITHPKNPKKLFNDHQEVPTTSAISKKAKDNNTKENNRKKAGWPKTWISKKKKKSKPQKQGRNKLSNANVDSNTKKTQMFNKFFVRSPTTTPDGTIVNLPSNSEGKIITKESFQKVFNDEQNKSKINTIKKVVVGKDDHGNDKYAYLVLMDSSVISVDDERSIVSTREGPTNNLLSSNILRTSSNKSTTSSKSKHLKKNDNEDKTNPMYRSISKNLKKNPLTVKAASSTGIIPTWSTSNTSFVTSSSPHELVLMEEGDEDEIEIELDEDDEKTVADNSNALDNQSNSHPTEANDDKVRNNNDKKYDCCQGYEMKHLDESKQKQQQQQQRSSPKWMIKKWRKHYRK